MTKGQAKSTILIDNEKTRVVEWRFLPGDSVGHHRHEYDYVVVPIMDGKIRVIDSSGEKFNQLKIGVPYFRNAGVEHNVFNANECEFAFIEVEFK